MEMLSLAPYLQDTMVLIGIALLVFFGFGRALLKSGLLQQVSANNSYRVLSQILLYGFFLSIAIILLGFGLKYREMSMADQKAAARLVASELASNKAIAAELAANSATILGNAIKVATLLRDQRVPILSGMFPIENLTTSMEARPPSMLATDALQGLLDRGILRNKLELRRFNAAASLISQTIDRTRNTLTSLSDEGGARYSMKDVAWSAQMPHLRQVHVVDMTGLGSAYADLSLSRSEYAVVVKNATDYLDSVSSLLSPRDLKIDAAKLTRALSAERLFIAVANRYADAMARRIEEADNAIRKLNDSVSAID